MRSEFESALLREGQAGQLPLHTDVTALADFFYAIVKGLGVLHKALTIATPSRMSSRSHWRPSHVEPLFW